MSFLIIPKSKGVWDGSGVPAARWELGPGQQCPMGDVSGEEPSRCQNGDRKGRHTRGGCGWVCLCVQTQVSLSFGLPASCSHLSLAALNWKTRGQVSPGDAACTGQPPGHSAGQRRVERGPWGGHRGCESTGASSCLPSL